MQPHAQPDPPAIIPSSSRLQGRPEAPRCTLIITGLVVWMLHCCFSLSERARARVCRTFSLRVRIVCLFSFGRLTPAVANPWICTRVIQMLPLKLRRRRPELVTRQCTYLTERQVWRKTTCVGKFIRYLRIKCLKVRDKICTLAFSTTFVSLNVKM